MGSISSKSGSSQEATGTGPFFVSVIVPAYNGMPYIAKAIESVRTQTYPYWELVICDNRSTDGTVECVQEVLKQNPDPRIRLVTYQEHLPMAENWNRALDHVRHGLAKIFPCDDILLPNCLEIQVGQLEENPDAGFATSCKEVIDATGRRLFNKKPIEQGKYDWAELGTRCLYAAGSNPLGEPGAVLFRSDLLKSCGVFDPNYKYYIDLDLSLRFLKKSKVCVWGKPLYQFRVHGSSGTATSRNLFVREFFQLLQKYEADIHLSERPFARAYFQIKTRAVMLLRTLVFWFCRKFT